MTKGKSILFTIGLFIIGIILTFVIIHFVRENDERHSQREFKIATDDIKIKIQSRINSYIQFLRSSSSHHMSSDTITRNEWKKFVDGSKISENLMGFQGAAYILIIPNDQLQNHIYRFKDEVNDNYSVFPDGVSEIYTPIVFIEPLTGRNLTALGYNISSNPYMLRAIEDSRDSSRVMLTDKVTLIQDETSNDISGIVIYSPVYRKELSLKSVEERRTAIMGWTALSFRVNDLMAGILGVPDEFGHNSLHLKVYDSRGISRESLLYNSESISIKKNNKSTIKSLTLPMNLNGKEWTLLFTQPKFGSFMSNDIIILIVGFTISLLLSFLAFSLFNTVFIAKRIAKELTSDLLGKNEEIEKLSSVVEQSTNSILITDTSGKIVYTNPKFSEVTGYSSEEVLGVKPSILSSGAQPKVYYTEMWEKILTGETWQGEFNNKNKSGKLFWEHATIFPLKNKDHELTNFIIVKEDISALKKSEAKFRGLYESLDMGTVLYEIVLDDNGNPYDCIFSDLNDKYEKLSGYKYEDVIGKSLLEINPKIEPYWIKTLGQVAISGKSTYFENYYKEHDKYYSFYGYRQKKNQCTCLVRDITESKRAQEKIKQSEERLTQIIENSKDWIWEVDNKGLYTYSSDMVEVILGFKSNELINKKYIYSFLDEESIEASQKILLDIIKQKKSFNNIINRYISIEGDIVWVSTSGIPMLDNNGDLIGYRGAHSDITKRKKIEFELVNSKEKAEESNQLKTEFFQNLSHEIRTPMNGITGFSELIGDPDLSDLERKNYSNIIQNSSKQLLHIIDDILEISSLETKQVKVIESQVCLNDLLFELFSVFDGKARENKTPLYLKKGASNTESTVFTDKIKLTKILGNLLENSIKFTQEGNIEFGYKLKNKEIEIYVKDTGIGIELEKHESIFERFSQVEKELEKKTGGLGLGLSIVKENVELLKGRIKLVSEKGMGSTFFISIPYKPVLSINEEEIKNECTILIAEDEEMNYLYLEILIHDKLGLNCKILHALNGLEAVEFCKNNAHIDLVLMDLKMPIMNGFEATNLIREFRPDLPIIAQSAYSTPEDKNKAVNAGCNDFISKPIDEEDLKNSIFTLMNDKLP